jgi:AmmeMemoRadiSam system protein B/AmmeMemoRadiSam system protein A
MNLGGAAMPSHLRHALICFAICSCLLLVWPFKNAVVAGVARMPVFAGRFYPADQAELNALLEALEQKARETKVSLPANQTLKAIILPHAGYIYSGWTAAHAVHVLDGTQFQKVIVLAPDHRVGFRNGMISAVDAYRTPLGDIGLHRDAVKLREGSDLFAASRLSDKSEHSLEVLLPFLQHFLPAFEMVPIVLGPSDASAVAQALAPHLATDTLLAVSSDLSHFLSYDEAVSKDRETIDMILKLDAEALARRREWACGREPIRVLLALAQRFDWRPHLLHYSNSGDTAGDKARVVGYATIAFFGPAAANSVESSPEALTPSEGQILVQLARATLEDAFRAGTVSQSSLQARLDAACFDRRNGTFVTLKKKGQLRGCIGSLVSNDPLRRSIAHNAYQAAFRDPRFQPVQADELDELAISVSVLTPPARLDYSGADDLLKRLVPHRDGVIIRHGSLQATFLPQVWQQLPQPQAFLGALCRKAGLPADAWHRDQLTVYTYRAQYFDETP